VSTILGLGCIESHLAIIDLHSCQLCSVCSGTQPTNSASHAFSKHSSFYTHRAKLITTEEVEDYGRVKHYKRFHEDYFQCSHGLFPLLCAFVRVPSPAMRMLTPRLLFSRAQPGARPSANTEHFSGSPSSIYPYLSEVLGDGLLARACLFTVSEVGDSFRRSPLQVL